MKWTAWLNNLRLILPTGHIVVSFRSADDLQRAEQALVDRGLQASTWVSDLTPATAASLGKPGDQTRLRKALWRIWERIKTRREQARNPCALLVVQAISDPQVATVAEVAQAAGAMAAHRYRFLVMDELIDMRPDPLQHAAVASDVAHRDAPRVVLPAVPRPRLRAAPSASKPSG